MDACVEVLFVGASKFSISSMKAFVEHFVEGSVDVDSVKASIASAKAYIASMKASMGGFVEVTSMEVFVETFVEAPVGVTLMRAVLFFYLSSWNISWKLSWKIPWKLLP